MFGFEATQLTMEKGPAIIDFKGVEGNWNEKQRHDLLS